jgi:hypothetical protein
MSIFDKLFRRQPNNQVSGQTSEKQNLPTIEEFPQLNPEARMGVIMALGDSGKLKYFPFLKYAVLIETDQNVKFAALKRIHLFKDHPDTIPMLTELKNNGYGQKFEPYFSMALSRLGLISLEEFEKMINNS